MAWKRSGVQFPSAPPQRCWSERSRWTVPVISRAAASSGASTALNAPLRTSVTVADESRRGASGTRPGRTRGGRAGTVNAPCSSPRPSCPEANQDGRSPSTNATPAPTAPSANNSAQTAPRSCARSPRRSLPRMRPADRFAQKSTMKATGHSRDTPGQTPNATNTATSLHHILYQGILCGWIGAKLNDG